jgi:hypothetical protein
MRSNACFFCKCFAVFLIVFVTGCSKSNDKAAVIAPTVFIRGMEAGTGTVYSVSVVKPKDDAVMKDLHGEIILPSGARLTDLLVAKSIDRAYGALNKEGKVGLVWEQALVASRAPVEPFSFVLDAPMTQELEFYLRWTDESGQRVVENFFEVPPVFNASIAREDISLTGEGYVRVGDTGVQLLAKDRAKPLALHVEVLPASFNPPESLGAIWWCSIVSIDGLPEGESVQVVVPLRRPVAPFTALQMVRRAADGSWVALKETAIVTADGQYATYVHTGGSIATGGPEAIRPADAVVSADKVEVAKGIAGRGTRSSAEFTVFSSVIKDGSSNTIIVGEATTRPATAVPATAQPVPSSIQDGSSNTIILGEATAPPAAAQPTGGLQDATSGSPIAGKPTVVPATAQATPGGFPDATSGSPIAGEPTTVPATAQPPPSGIQDGTSNTIIVGEATAAPATGRPTPGIQDGSSNTIIVGESTAAPAAGRPTPGIQDGSSNTIILGEATAAPATAVPTTIPPAVQVNPESPSGTAGQLGEGGVRIQISVKAGQVVQCQVGRVNCATISRRAGQRGK